MKKLTKLIKIVEQNQLVFYQLDLISILLALLNIWKMSLQSYKSCIQCLEKQINSKQQQRKSMFANIQNIGHQLQQQINRNKILKDQNIFLAKSNQSLLIQLNRKAGIINSSFPPAIDNQPSDIQLKQKLTSLETEKRNLEEQLSKKQSLLNQRSMKLRDIETKTRNSASLIEGYKKIVEQKARQIARSQSKMRQMQIQKQSMRKQIQTMRNKHEAEKQKTYEVKQPHSDVHLVGQQLQTKVKNLEKQLIQDKQLHQSQILTLNFNHKQQTGQLNESIRQLTSKNHEYSNEIKHINQATNQGKLVYESQSSNKDQIVNSLIQEINFLKQQKYENQKQSQYKQEQVNQKIKQIGLEAILMQMKFQGMSDEIQTLKKNVFQKCQQIQELQKLIQKLRTTKQSGQSVMSSQLENMTKKLQKAKQEKQQTQFSKNQQIQRLLKQLQTVNTQRQNDSSSANDNIINLKTQLQKTQLQIQKIKVYTRLQTQRLQHRYKQLQQRLRQSSLKLTNANMKSIQLQQSLRSLKYETMSTCSYRDEMQSVVGSHQFTIMKLQQLMQQSKVINGQLNKLLIIKSNQIQQLQASNKMFRRQKVQLIRKQEEYRRKIMEYRNNANANSRSFRQSTVRAVSKRSVAECKSNDRMGAINDGISPRGSRHGPNYVRSRRTKTLIPTTWTDKTIHINDDHSIQSHEDYSLQLPEITQGTFRQQRDTHCRTSAGISNSLDNSNVVMKKKDKIPQIMQDSDLGQTENPSHQYSQAQIEHVYSNFALNGTHNLLDRVHKQA